MDADAAKTKETIEYCRFKDSDMKIFEFGPQPNFREKRGLVMHPHSCGGEHGRPLSHQCDVGAVLKHCA